MKYSIVLLLTMAVSLHAAPADVNGAASLSASSGGVAPPISFENGNVNVNFAGFKASAGLGGLITGNAAHGGLQASAETPFGQKAAAGLGGVADGNGGLTSGGLYAGATAGGNIGAGASLGGSVDSSGELVGTKTAGASSGASGVYEIDTKFNGPSEEKVIVTEEETPVTAVRTIETKHTEPENVQKFVVHKEFSYQPVITRTKTLTEETVHEQPQTVVTKQVVTQPVQTVYYKTRFRSRPHHWHKFVTFNTGYNNDANIRSFAHVAPAEHRQEVHTVTKVAAPPTHTHIVKEVRYGQQEPVRQEYNFQYVPAPPIPFFGHFNAQGVAHIQEVPTSHGQGVIAAKTNNVDSTKTSVNYSANVRAGEVINDIFNIPIQTLSAVNKLVGNIVGGGGASVHVNKQLRVN